MRKYSFKEWMAHIWHSLPLLVSAAALAVLAVRSAADLISAALFLMLVFGVCLIKLPKFARMKARLSAVPAVLSGLAALCFGYLFFDFMKDSGTIRSVAVQMGLPSELLLGICAAAGSLCSLYFLLYFLTYLFESIRLPSCDTSLVREKLTGREILACLVSAVAVISLCSKSSPLYPINDWVDANCFFTIGKSMLEGLMPYRDLYDHKGPLLYLLHAMAAWISFKSFFGVWLLEVAAAFGFLLICRRILMLYHRDSSLLWIPVIAVLTYSVYGFLHGDSVEEFSLPLIAWCQYCGLKALRTDREISFREGFWIGVTSACVLWMKYTLLGFYIGWFAAWVVIKTRQGRFSELFRLVGSILAGIAALTLPILAYFLWQGALGDLFKVYFYDNLFLYSGQEAESGGLLSSFFRGFLNLQGNQFPASLLLACGVFGAWKPGHGRESFLTALSALGMFGLLYFSGVIHEYYALVFGVFIPFGVAAATDWVRELGNSFSQGKHKSVGTILVLTGCCLFVWLSCSNRYLLGQEKEKLPQYRFAQIMEQEENATLLNYGFLDGGFYNAAGIVPNCRYHCKINVPNPEMMETQNRFLEEGLVDFVVTRDEQLDHENYTLVAESSGFYEDSVFDYYLYRLTAK